MQPDIYLSEVHLPLSGLDLPSGPYPKVDYGYLAHVHLKRAFGDALGAFSIERADLGALVCLAYLKGDELALKSKGSEAATLELRRLRRFPLLPVGKAIALRCKTVAIKRKDKVEKDAYLAHLERQPEPYEQSEFGNRIEVYTNWATQLLGRQEGLDVQQVSIGGFKLEEFSRWNHEDKRQRRVMTRPVVELESRCLIRDSVEFSELLFRGLGRHRAFGLGMLKVGRA